MFFLQILGPNQNNKDFKQKLLVLVMNRSFLKVKNKDLRGLLFFPKSKCVITMKTS